MNLLDFSARMLEAQKRGTWLFDLAMLRLIFREESDDALKVSIHRRLKDGSLLAISPMRAAERDCDDQLKRAKKSRQAPQGLRGLYVMPSASLMPRNAIGTILDLIRPHDLTYLSLEYRLSELGAISQAPSVATFMTTGTGGLYNTMIGDIELVHTKRRKQDILTDLEFDKERGYYAASPSLAYKDLRSTRRSTIDLVDMDDLCELIEEQNAAAMSSEFGRR